MRRIHTQNDLDKEVVMDRYGRPMSKGRQEIAAAIRAYRFAEARGDLTRMAEIRREYRI